MDKKATFGQIIKRAYPKEWIEIKQIKNPTTILAPTISSKWTWNNIILDDNKITNYILCNECKPEAGQRIIAKTGKDGVKIHNLNCKSLKTISFDKLLEAHREWQEKTNYKVSMELRIYNKYWSILNIMTTFSELNIIILQISIKNNWDWSSTISLESEFSNPSKIAFLLNNLKKYDDSIHFIKKIIS